MPDADLTIVGAGAAGLFAAIHAGRTHPNRRILLLDSARTLGAKILVAGGGRCNVTHHAVSAADYAGSSPHAIATILRRFDVPATIAFFRDLGVTLKREETDKLFPTTDSAHTVLDALLRAVRDAGVELKHPQRVETVERTAEGFRVSGPWGHLTTAKLILATGGQALPKSGSDGHGYTLARALGHTTTARIFPTLVPLTLPKQHALTTLSGLAAPATLTVHSATGKTLASATGPALCTHFGLSGPAVLDISRHYLTARFADPATQLRINWLPGVSSDAFEQTVLSAGRTAVVTLLAETLPRRLAQTLCQVAALDPATPAAQLTRPQRKAFVQAVTADPLPVTGDRGFTHAEVTAGGVPLSELKLTTLESRVTPGLHLCGEICDVDGRIGGFNFQWAWASGYVAGVSA